MKVARHGMDGRNLSRLNPILGLNRVPKELTGWTKLITLDDLGTIELTCDGGKNLVPHGIDADVMFGLTTAYNLQGQPENATVRLNLQELCACVGMTPGGQVYRALQESLQRLKDVSLTAKSCWAVPVQSTNKWRWRSVCFNVVESITVDDHIEGAGRPYQFTATTTVEVRLNPDLAQSLREGHTRTLDLAFYAQLSQPLARLVYRTLEELRETTAGGHMSLTFPVLTWAEHLGFRELDPEPTEENTPSDPRIPATRVLSPTKIRRALEPAHTSLREGGYLQDVTYVGRGRMQSVTYTFTAVYATRPVDLKLVGLLTTRGVTLGRAQALALKYGREAIEQAARRFDARIAGGYRPKNRGGVLADMLTNADKYAEAIPDATTTRVLNAAARPQKAQEAPSEAPAPPRTHKSAETMLLGALKATEADRELRAQIIAAYLEGQGRTLDLLGMSRMADAEARTHARELLASWQAG